MKTNTMFLREASHQATESVRPYPKMTLTVDDLAAELNISRNSAYALADRKDFPSFHVGRRLLVNRAMLQEWMNQNCQSLASRD
ncbi:MAG: helix-turn-helix domain-containing protein [Aristaeellaceae bacterium]